MPKSKQPRVDTNAAPSRGRASESRDAAGDMLFAIWSALVIYLVLFYLWPLARGLSESQTTLRRGHVWVSLLVGDEMVASWVEGCTWNSLAERGRILIAAAAILTTAIVGGWACLSLVGINRLLTRLETFVFAAGVGLQLTSLITLALGLAGLLRVELFAVLGLIVFVLAGMLRWRRRSIAPANEPDSAGAETASAGGSLQLSRNWLWLAVPFVVVLVLGGMLPPVEFDVREYHLQAPKEFFQAGRITFLPHNVYANMPLGAEMLALLGMVVCGDWQIGALVGKTLIACYAPLTALGLLAAGRRLATPAAGIVAALVYISIPWIAMVSVQGLVEGAVAFYLFAALYAVLVWRRGWRLGQRSYRLLGLAGFLAGAAVSCKYPSAVFSVVPLGAWITWIGLESAFRRSGAETPRARWTAAAMPLVVFLGACTIGCGLWLAKNTLLTGNPAYPLLYDWFDGLTRTAAKNDQWQRAHGPPNYDLVDLGRRAAGVMLTSDWISPLVVPLAALALTAWRRQPLVRGLVIYFVYVMATWWLFTHRIDRFWVPIMPVAALLAGVGATWTNTRAWRITLAGLLAFGLVSNFAVITGGVMGENRYLAELDTLRRDSGHTDPWHLYLNQHKNEVRRVLLVADAQPFDLEVPGLYNTVFDDSIFEQLARGKTDRQVRVALADNDISHIYVAWGEVARYRSPGNYGFTRFVSQKAFDDLVAAGVLEPLPKIDDHRGQLFRVVPLRRAPH